MKRFLLSVVLATTLALTSCQFDDSDIWGKLDEYGESIRDHEQRISALEELCKQMNTNIEALQTLVDALEKRDYVTNVSEVRSNGEVIGYTISFAYSDTITIYHGQDGKDGANGADGKDGYTPQIGVMKDTDGIYYWTLDGEWLLDAKGNKIKAVGTDGKDGQDGANGTDGKDGQNGTNGSDGKDGQDGTNGTDGKDGADGKDGVTPQLKIENDYWYVSYDNGATWVQLGKATGEDGKDGQDGNDGADGSDGADGEDGDSIFKSVTQDDEYVYFNLADGTMITLPKHDKENIQFEDLQVKAICCKNWDTNNDGELSYAEAAAVGTIGTIFKGNTNIIAFTELKYFTGITEIPANAFNGCTTLWKIKIPENVQIIGDSAFNGCKGISYIDLPSVITTIGDKAFYGCTALLNITFPQHLDTIGEYAFYQCALLTNITLPNSVTSIGNYAFQSCGEINISIPYSAKTIGTSILSNCSGTLKIDRNVTSAIMSDSKFSNVFIGDNAKSIGNNAFNGYTSLKYIHIGSSISSIGEAAFYKCENLTNVDISNLSKWYEIDHDYYYLGTLSEKVNTNIVNFSLNGVNISIEGDVVITDETRKIGKYAFYYSNITSAIIPNSVKTIGIGAFQSCGQLTTVSLPNNLTTIAEAAFSNSGLMDITIPDSVISIENQAFSGCGLISATIGKSCTYIGKKAFIDCAKLTTIYCKATIPPVIHYFRDIYYEVYHDDVRAFPTNTKIYVSRAAYNLYTQYSSYDKENEYSQANWWAYKSQISPYDFEE